MEQYFGLVNKPISGRDLKTLFNNLEFTNLLYSGKLLIGASTSLKKIKNYYGSAPSINGANISGINLIRDTLFFLAKDKQIIGGLTIIAPHTHWPNKHPVIYHFDKKKDAYIIGPHSIDENISYTPVSFVFNLGVPLPYEWVDDSIKIIPDEWQSCFQLIHDLNYKLLEKDIPFGIAIDFRFRKSLYEEAQASLEVPIVDQADYYKDFSYIVSKPLSTDIDSNQISEQVSWSPQSDLVYNFSNKERHVLDSLRSYLNSIEDPIEREKILYELKQNLIKQRL